MDRKNIYYGIVGSIGLLVVYFSILTAFNGVNHAIFQFNDMWYLIVPLVVGFGIQIGLYSHIRTSMKSMHSGKAEVAAAGGVSSGSMIACCVHHVTDVLPIVGLSGALLFFAEFQSFFMVLGIFSNVVGITMLLNVVQKHKLYNKKGVMADILKLDMKTARNYFAVFSVVFLGLMFFSITSGPSLPVSANVVANENINLGSELESKTSEANGLSVEVTPTISDGSIEFYVAMNTHEGSLDYDLTKISVLEDEKGNVYNPLSWDGSPPGGHHRYGTLTFPLNGAERLTLTLKNMYEIDRVFEWRLN